MKRLYLDLCVYNRPFDFQGDERIELETNAFLYVLEMTQKGHFELIISKALVFENSQNPNEQKKQRISLFFGLSPKYVLVEDNDICRSKSLKKYGLSYMDSLHIAIAEKTKADYFITCDDDIVKISKKHAANIKIKIVNLEEFLSLEVH